MTTHRMTLHAAPFAAIASGRKTVELRLDDDKRRRISVGDTILFTRRDSTETLIVAVRALHRFPDFAALYAALLPTMGAEALGYAPNEHPAPSDMEQYYAPEEIRRLGVVGIELERIR